MKNLRSYIISKKTILIMIISMSLPAIGEMALNTMLGVADTIMISRLVGKEALSAVGFANQIVFTLIFIFSAFNTGAVAMISRSFGEKNYEKLKKIAEQNVTLNLMIGLFILILSFFFSRSIFSIFDISPEIYENAIKYFNIILIGFVPMFLSFSYAAILRGSGDTKTPMVITGIANVFNIVANYVLILGIGPFPALGIEGAAWATSVSRVLAMALYIYVLYFKNSQTRMKFELFLDKNIIKPLWQISLPGAIEQALMQLSFLIMAVIISQLDTVSEASFRILIQIESLSFMPAVGMSIATATLVGKSLGEKDVPKAFEVGYLSSAIAILWGIFIGVVFILFPEPSMALFTKDQQLIERGAKAMLFIGLNQVGLNFHIIMSGALRGAGDTKAVMIINTLRLWTLFVPLMYVFVILMDTGLSGIWYAEMISFAVFGLQLLFRFKNGKWANVKVESGTETEDNALLCDA